MVDYSQFVFHERDHSYGYAEEVSVASGSDYCPRIEHRQLYHHYQIKPVVGSMLEACQDMPLNLSLNSPQSSLWESMPVTSAVAVTSPAYSDEADIDQPGEGAGGESPELGSLFIVSDLGAHIAQEEIVESEIVEEEETEQEEEESTTDEEDEGVQQVYSHELSKNSRLRSKVNDLTKKIERIRGMLEAAARKEKDVTQIDISPQLVAQATESRVSMYTVTTTESELEIKSEGELDSVEMVPGLRAIKRSRNQSWPQMVDSSARKKEQNKMASKRFRERKKQELEKAKLEIQELEAKNELLRHQADRMQLEADSLKQVLVRLKLIRILEYASGDSTIQRI